MIKSKDLKPDFAIVHKIVEDVTQRELTIIEKQFSIRIQPKPWWLPFRLWRWLLGKMLVLEIFNGGKEGG